MQAFNTFVAAVRSVPTVEQVRGQVAGAYVHIVTYLNQSTLEERAAVYAAQMHLYDQFPDLRLEFDAIDREGYPVEAGESIPACVTKNSRTLQLVTLTLTQGRFWCAVVRGVNGALFSWEPPHDAH